MIFLTVGHSVTYDGEQATEEAERLFENQASHMIGNPSAAEQIDTIIENTHQSDGKWWKTQISFNGVRPETKDVCVVVKMICKSGAAYS